MTALLRTLAGVASVLRRGIVMLLGGGALGGRLPERGSKAPPFSARGAGGVTVTLEQYAGRSHLVLFFFPKADTPG